MNEGIFFFDYESIQDSIVYLGENLNLKFKVYLCTKNNNGGKISFHREVSYPSNYTNAHIGRSIKREIRAYLMLEIKDDFKNSITITYQDMIMFRSALNAMADWLNKTGFKIIDGKLTTIKKKVVLSFEFSGKSVMFSPTVMTVKDQEKKGIRLTFQDSKAYVEIAENYFMGLKYVIDTFDIYQNAIICLNYIQRPEFGTNNFDMGTEKKDNSYFSNIKRKE